ncbi:MAG TPA: hydantoinase B/oxoprolinase family protein [Stellaceae bacterium]|jgi:N-methylhydantoinase B|nr:hydantoinase B/oxoprolinase family protein [Stellaceae bacterium]
MAADPITVEVLRSALPAIADEMSYVLKRTSYNMMIYEVGDYSCAILDKEGNLLAQNGGGVSHFLADMGVVIRDGVQRIKKFSPGDVILMNHQAVCGQHLNNMCVYTPFFWQGELFGFTIIRAHWIDVGGYSTGFGAGSAASDPWLEGLQFNQLKIYDAGKPNETLLAMIADNIRYPESSMGDLEAQTTACNLGLKRMEELFAKYGKPTVEECIQRIFAESETHCRQVISEFEDGSYEFETEFDDSAAAQDGPVRIHVKVTVAGSDMTIDLSGCSGERSSGINGRTLAAPYIAYKALTSPIDPVNEGSFKALKVILPEGCFMMAKFPAPMAGWSVALPSVIDAILAAMAPARKSMTPAAHKGAMGDNMTFFGIDPRNGKRFVVQSTEGGGWGGRPFEDGPSASCTICQGDVRNGPIESLEQRFPIIVEQRGMRTDSAGAGTFRGGLGLDVKVRNLVAGRWNITQTGRHRVPPWGLWGGHTGGKPDRLVLKAGENDWKSVNANWYQVPSESRVIIRSAGGGGWGDPLEREPMRVIDDIRDGFVSVEAAKSEYGVIAKVNGKSGLDAIQLDAEATARTRQEMRATHAK